MIQRHIDPKLAYGCAWVGFDDTAVIARKVEKCVYGCRWASRSVTLSWKFGIGVKRHPSYIRDFEFLRVRVRILRLLAL